MPQSPSLAATSTPKGGTVLLRGLFKRNEAVLLLVLVLLLVFFLSLSWLFEFRGGGENRSSAATPAFSRFVESYRDRVVFHAPAISEEKRGRVLASAFAALPPKSRIALQGPHDGDVAPTGWLVPFLVLFAATNFLGPIQQEWLLPVTYALICLI